jgi:hypothetical protein
MDGRNFYTLVEDKSEIKVILSPKPGDKGDYTLSLTQSNNFNVSVHSYKTIHVLSASCYPFSGRLSVRIGEVREVRLV